MKIILASNLRYRNITVLLQIRKNFMKNSAGAMIILCAILIYVLYRA